MQQKVSANCWSWTEIWWDNLALSTYGSYWGPGWSLEVDFHLYLVSLGLEVLLTSFLIELLSYY